MEALNLIEQHKTEIEEGQSSAKKALAAGAKIQSITTDAGLAAAGDYRARLKVTIKMYQDKFDGVQNPIKAGLKAFAALWRPKHDPLNAENERIRELQGDYQTAKDNAAKAEQKRLNDGAAKKQAALEKKAEKKGVEPPAPAPVQQVAPVENKVYGKIAETKFRTNWTYRIKDIKLVPLEYIEVNSVAVNKDIKRAVNPVREISGLEIYSEKVVS